MSLVNKSAKELRDIGLNKFKQENYQEALESYEKAVAIDPNYSEAYRGIGGSHLNLGNYETAINYLNKALEINPQDEKAFINRGLTYHNLDNYLIAIEDFSKAIEIKIDYGKAYLGRGRSYYHSSRYQEAVIDFNKAIELGYESPHTLYLRGLSQLSLKNFKEAAEDFTRAIERDPQNYLYYELRANCSLSQGIISAIPDFEKFELLSASNGEIIAAQYAKKIRQWINSIPKKDLDYPTEVKHTEIVITPLSIAQAKEVLSKSFDVTPEQIEIIIKT